MYNTKDVYSSEETSISSSLPELCAVLTLRDCALHCRTTTMEFLLWMFFLCFSQGIVENQMFQVY